MADTRRVMRDVGCEAVSRKDIRKQPRVSTWGKASHIFTKSRRDDRGQVACQGMFRPSLRDLIFFWGTNPGAEATGLLSDIPPGLALPLRPLGAAPIFALAELRCGRQF